MTRLSSPSSCQINPLEPYQSTCAVCESPAPFRCQRCGCEYYCGPEHQRIHWGTHKRVCRLESGPGPIADKQGSIATKCFAANEVICDQEPLVCAPANHDGLGPATICLACLAPLSVECAGDAVFCVCGFVFCRDRDCIQNRFHSHGGGKAHEDECALLQIYTHPLSESAWCTEDVWVLRALALRIKDSWHWTRLMQLACTQDAAQNVLLTKALDASAKMALTLESGPAKVLTQLKFHNNNNLQTALLRLYSVYFMRHIDTRFHSCVFAIHPEMGPTPNVLIHVRQVENPCREGVLGVMCTIKACRRITSGEVFFCSSESAYSDPEESRPSLNA